jgi:hypothetical protein
VASPSPEIVSRIAELQVEFQHIADVHPWICLAFMPTALATGKRCVILHIGEKAPGPAPALGLPGVDSPRDAALRVVVDHVVELTNQATFLINRVLKYESQIPADVQQEIREWEQQSRGYGWIRWLWYAARIQHVNRFENYTQAAATALAALKRHCLPEALSSGATKAPKKARMKVNQANEKAMRLARRLRDGFFAMSQRQQAEEIGCSFATWKRTEFFQKAEAKRPLRKNQKPSSPKTESFTSKREALSGEGTRNEVLNQLIKEQENDKELSPLDASTGMPRRVHYRKRL